MSRRSRSWMGLFAAAVGIATAVWVSNGHAATVEFRDLQVEVVGTGRPVVMIPGLNSAATQEQWEAGARQGAMGMSRNPANNESVAGWSLKSDRATSAQAMSELWGEDLRPLLPRVTTPTLVLGAWAAYEPMGSTMESTRKIFEGQYAGLNGVKVAMSPRGFHFLMWDDPDWLVGEVKGLLSAQ